MSVGSSLCHLKGMKMASAWAAHKATFAHSGQMTLKTMGLSPSKGDLLREFSL